MGYDCKSPNKYVCWKCRVSHKTLRDKDGKEIFSYYRSTTTPSCKMCGMKTTCVKASFRVPKRKDIKTWKLLDIISFPYKKNEYEIIGIYFLFLLYSSISSSNSLSFSLSESL